MEKPFVASSPWCYRLLLAAFFVLFITTSKGVIEAGDTWYSVRTARAILEGRLSLEPDGLPTMEGEQAIGRDGRTYSKYGIGLPLWLLPFVAAGGHNRAATETLVSIAAIPWAMLLAFTFWRAVAWCGASAGGAQLLVVGLMLGTVCWRYATSDFSEEAQAALLLVAVLGVFRRGRHDTLISGVAFGALISFKLVHLAYLPLFVAYLATRRTRTLGGVVAFLVPIAIVCVALAFLNWVRFGSPTESGYGAEAGRFDFSQLTHTLPMLLGSLDKGLFVFCPTVILGLFGARRFAIEKPAEFTLLAAICLVNLVIAGAWWSWEGGWSWGPRLLVPAVPLWLLPAAVWLRGPTPAWRTRVATVVVAVAAIAQIPGLLVSSNLINQVKQDLPPTERDRIAPAYLIATNVTLHWIATGDTHRYPADLFVTTGSVDVNPDTYPPRMLEPDIWPYRLARTTNRQWLRLIAAIGSALAVGLLIAGLLRP